MTYRFSATACILVLPYFLVHNLNHNPLTKYFTGTSLGLIQNQKYILMQLTIACWTKKNKSSTITAITCIHFLYPHPISLRCLNIPDGSTVSHSCWTCRGDTSVVVIQGSLTILVTDNGVFFSVGSLSDFHTVSPQGCFVFCLIKVTSSCTNPWCLRRCGIVWKWNSIPALGAVGVCSSIYSLFMVYLFSLFGLFHH